MPFSRQPDLYAPRIAEGSNIRTIPDGAAGIAATLDQMVEWTRAYRTDMTIRRQAEMIVAGIPGKNWLAEIDAVQAWVRDTIRYTQDINGVETLRSPVSLLFNPQGDCDDQALLAGTLLFSIGHPVRYVAIGPSYGDYDHVYAETKYAQQWLSVETTENVCVGWIPDNIGARMVRHV